MIFFFIAFAIVVSSIAASVKKGAESPRRGARDVTRRAVVVAKRMQVHGGEHAYTSYYATFEFEDNSRREIGLNGVRYGILAEGDRGMLTLNGGRFVSFVRSEDRFSAEDPDRAAHVCRACGAAYRGRVCEYCDTPWTAER